MKKKKYFRNNILPLSSILALVSVAALFFIFDYTFAWFTSTDSVKNSFAGTHLVAEIKEVFKPNDAWGPGQQTEKKVSIKNTGDTDAFVRVSLYEFLLSFQIDLSDQIGNGNLKRVDNEQTPIVNADDTNTWLPAAQSNGTFKNKADYLIAEKAWVSYPEKRQGMYQYLDPTRNATPFQYMILNFSDNVTTQIINSQNYWLYEDGYFYYSKLLKPNESTTNLLEGISLSDTVPNKFKNALYQMKVYMDAHDVTAPVIDSWNLSENSKAYQVLINQL